MIRARVQHAWYIGWPLGALCVLSASRWLIEGAVPATASTNGSLGAGCLLSGALLLLWAFTRPNRSNRQWSQKPWSAVTGTLLITAGPVFAGLLAGHSLSANNATLALTLCPIVVAVCSSATNEQSDAGVTARMWPGLAGLAGLLLLLPEPRFQDLRSWGGLACMPLCLGAGACLWTTPAAGRKYPQPTIIGGGLLASSAVFFGMHWFQGTHTAARAPISLQAAGLDATFTVLTLLALARAGAVRWSAQFLIVPLLGLGEGLIFLRPILDGRSVFGLALVALSAGYQILMALGEEASVLPLRLQTDPLPGATDDDLH